MLWGEKKEDKEIQVHVVLAATLNSVCGVYLSRPLVSMGMGPRTPDTKTHQCSSPGFK